MLNVSHETISEGRMIMKAEKSNFYLNFGKYLRVLLLAGVDEVTRSEDALYFRANGKVIAQVSTECGAIDNKFVGKKLKEANVAMW